MDEEIDIQTELGKIGQEIHKFECYLYTPEYDKYKYRLFFVKYEGNLSKNQDLGIYFS